MLSRPLHFTTALLLALLYLVVGLTGESAHYLAERLAVVGQGEGQRERERPERGYYHCHGPDYHWHFHPHEHDEEKESLAEGATSDVERPDPTTGFRAAKGEHQSHACPLLSVVAALKLTLAVRAEPLLGHDAGVCLCSHDFYFHDNHLGRLHLARGPPVIAPASHLG